MFTNKEVFSTCVEKYNCFNAAIRKGSAVLEPMDDIERYVSIVEKMQKTFISKNHDYGNSFATTWQEFGDKGPITGVWSLVGSIRKIMTLVMISSTLAWTTAVRMFAISSTGMSPLSGWTSMFRAPS